MIGGTDVVFWVEEHTPVAEIVVRTASGHWPDYVFQDADEPAPRPRDGWTIPDPAGREFFLYRDEAAAQSWIEDGATAENRNSLLYVILGNRRRESDGFRSITIVCDPSDPRVSAILHEVEAGFLDHAASAR